jgi:hypothetical protein
VSFALTRPSQPQLPPLYHPGNKNTLDTSREQWRRRTFYRCVREHQALGHIGRGRRVCLRRRGHRERQHFQCQHDQQNQQYQQRHGGSCDARCESSQAVQVDTQRCDRQWPKAPQEAAPRVIESADIVEFEPTMFTTTVTSGGIPLGMSLTER